MSKYSELSKELESIHESALYNDFADMVANISNLGVATAVLGGFLCAWCQDHDEDFTAAIALMWIADKRSRGRCRNDS